MHKSFGKNKNGSKAIGEALGLVIFIAFSVLAITILANSSSIYTTSALFVLSVSISLYIWDGVKSGYQVYPVVVTEKFLLINRRYDKYSVFELSKVKNVKIFRNRIFFLYRGWPILAYIHSLTKNENVELINLLSEKHS